MTGFSHRDMKIYDTPIGIDIDGEPIGLKDEETGEKFWSLRTFIIAICGLITLVIIAQIFFQAALLSVDRWVVKDPEFQGEKIKKKIWSYVIIGIVLIIAFTVITRYILKEPVHLFY